METNTPKVTQTAATTGSAPVSASVTPVKPLDTTVNPAVSPTTVQPAIEVISTTDAEEMGQIEPGRAVKELIRTRKRAQDAELENARLKGIIEGRGGMTTTTTPSTTPITAPEPEKEPTPPSPDKFEKYEDYEKAHEAYLIDKAKWSIKQDQKRDKDREDKEKKVSTWNGKMVAAQKRIPDLIPVITNPSFRQTDTLLSLIQDSEIGPDMAYYLAKHPEDTDRLNLLPPHLAAKEFGKIEDRLLNPPAAPAPKVISQAPEPITEVTPQGGAVTDDDQNLPVDEFVKRRNAREIARRRGQTI